MERQEKKSQFQQDEKRGFTPWIIIALVLVIAAGVAAWSAVGGKGGYDRLTGNGGVVAIPVDQVSDGKAHFFSYRHGNALINFFVLKSHDGHIRAAFDTCDVCYKAKQGYRQDGDFMVCNNCEQRFRSDMINEIKGGCNPAPLNRTIADGKLIIAEADLATGAWYFQ
jgi:uncharacterized membrane protein